MCGVVGVACSVVVVAVLVGWLACDLRSRAACGIIVLKSNMLHQKYDTLLIHYCKYTIYIHTYTTKTVRVHHSHRHGRHHGMHDKNQTTSVANMRQISGRRRHRLGGRHLYAARLAGRRCLRYFPIETPSVRPLEQPTLCGYHRDQFTASGVVRRVAIVCFTYALNVAALRFLCARHATRRRRELCIFITGR